MGDILDQHLLPGTRRLADNAVVDVVAIVGRHIAGKDAAVGNEPQKRWVVGVNNAGCDVGKAKLLIDRFDGGLEDVMETQAAGDQPPDARDGSVARGAAALSIERAMRRV